MLLPRGFGTSKTLRGSRGCCLGSTGEGLLELFGERTGSQFLWRGEPGHRSKHVLFDGGGHDGGVGQQKGRCRAYAGVRTQHGRVGADDSRECRWVGWLFGFGATVRMSLASRREEGGGRREEGGGEGLSVALLFLHPELRRYQ